MVSCRFNNNVARAISATSRPFCGSLEPNRQAQMPPAQERMEARLVFPYARRPRLALAFSLVVLAVCIVLAAIYISSSNPAVAYVISTDRSWPNENWHGAFQRCAAEGFMLASLYSAGDARLLKAAALSADQNVIYAAARTLH